MSVTTATGFFTERIPSDTDTCWPAKTAQEKQPNLFQSINILVARRVSLIALCRPAETIEENQDTSNDEGARSIFIISEKQAVNKPFTTASGPPYEHGRDARAM